MKFEDTDHKQIELFQLTDYMFNKVVYIFEIKQNIMLLEKIKQ